MKVEGKTVCNKAFLTQHIFILDLVNEEGQFFLNHNYEKRSLPIII